jgi:hypothetical protein
LPSVDAPSGGRGSRGRCQPLGDPIRSRAAAGRSLIPPSMQRGPGGWSDGRYAGIALHRGAGGAGPV